MSAAELILRGGRVVTASGVAVADVAIAEGRIVAVEPDLSGWTASEDLEATGLHVFPGGVDSHVHFNEPGRTGWETIACGSAALAAGGYTAFVDMPLNSDPVTIDGAAFDLKLGAAAGSSLVDFGLWGGLVPGNLDRLEELVQRGVIGFKAFMCPSGIDAFPGCDDRTLREGMRRIARLGSILLVHAEDPAIVDALIHRATAGGQNGALDFIRSRPAAAELEAISRAIGMAGETGCRLHVVHVSTAGGVELIREARRSGVDVSGETCPHYLLYVEEDMERLGGAGKCAPPFRSAADRDGLWRLIADGALPMVVSDHSPSSPDLKRGGDFFKLWGGISGCQSTRQLLLSGDGSRSLALPTIAAVTATNVARRFGLASKGEVAPGFDADLWLVDLSHEDVVRGRDLLYRNAFSAHEGRPIRGRTVRTMVRGRTVFAAGRPSKGPAGRLIRPAPPASA
ncbi:allantoinase AllB [bacterium]|nr:MAG: allantoinase AllB [bacterium]